MTTDRRNLTDPTGDPPPDRAPVEVIPPPDVRRRADGPAPGASRPPPSSSSATVVRLAAEASPVGQPAVWWRLADLDPWGENPRHYTNAAIASLADKIRRYGFNEIIGAHWPTRRIVRGHRRRLAMLLILEDDPTFALEGSPGPGYVPVRFAGGPWEGAAELDALADNREQENGAWDTDQVGRLVARWTDEGLDLAQVAVATAFGDQELREILAQLRPLARKPSEVPAPGVPAPPREPSSCKGEVYQLGPHRLICGDTTSLADLSRLMGDELADAIVTDPPFAVYGSSTGLAADVADDKVIRPFFRDVLAGARAVARPFAQVYVCCDWRSWSAWWEAAQRVKLHPSNLLVWDKGNPGLGSQWANGYELIGFWTAKPERTRMFRATETGTRLVLRPNILRDIPAEDAEDGPERRPLVNLEDPAIAARLEAQAVDGLDARRSILTYGRVHGAERVHNAAKPIALLEELITAATDPGGLVVDLFGGGGSTLLAAAKSERVAYLSEIDPLWCDVIRHRWTAWATEAGVDPGPGALVLENAPQLLGAAAGGKPAKRSRKPKPPKARGKAPADPELGGEDQDQEGDPT